MAKAARREAEAAAERLLASVWNPDATPVREPVTALQQLAGQLQHAANVLGGRLDEQGLESAAAVAWTKVLRELRQALEGMERLDLSGKVVQIEHQRAQMVTAAFLAALDALRLSPVDRSSAVRVFLEQLEPGVDGPVDVAALPARNVAAAVGGGAQDVGEQLATVLRRVLDRLELDDRQRGLVPVVVPEELRRMGREQAEGAVVRGDVG